MRKKLILLTLSLILFSNSYSYAEFKVNQIDLEDPVIETETETETEIIYRTDSSDRRKIRNLKDENEELEDEIDDLESRIEELLEEIKELKKDTNDKKQVNKTIKAYPLYNELKTQEISSLEFVEPTFTNETYLWINRNKIYTSRVSKAALNIIEGKNDSLKVYMGDLDISIKEWVKIPTLKIAYWDYIDVLVNYSEDGILDYVTVQRKGD